MTWKELFAEAVRIAYEKDYLSDMLECYMDNDYDAMEAEFENFFGEKMFGR